ncbi:hypothetical protein [Asticcacaulis sp. YBE204]|uniref:hypothetical protein n=1 Tax=Asticcacaulis sp. YBE204 TaxID=1282363 RepID=UPI0003C40762|nr:hypothetical protein [Asticcacaulis sp. YBE204]ESQ79250.1 hypothetical protein AEYBE204_09580 [Asticcacaulis sp. YBE204]
MKRSEIVLSGGEQLLLTEDALDTALGETGELISRLTRLRVSNQMSAVYGQNAMDAIIESASLLNGARGAMVRAHGCLDEVRGQLGCSTVAVGNNQDKPIQGRHRIEPTTVSTSQIEV